MSKPNIIEMKGNLGGFSLLKGKTSDGMCPECDVTHDPAAPHNQQSLAYQYAFREKHGRWPTWHDAMRHCSAALKLQWLEALAREGVEVGIDPVRVSNDSVRAAIDLGARALSVRQPWAWLIVNGFKPFENRDWSPGNPARCWLGKQLARCAPMTILVHACKGMTEDEYDQAYFMAKGDYDITLPPMKDLPRGGIVGVVNVVRWHDERQPMAFSFGSGIELAHAAPHEFLPCKGALGFFKPKLEGEVAA
jgi:hypothetical protein